MSDEGDEEEAGGRRGGGVVIFAKSGAGFSRGSRSANVGEMLL